MLNIFVNTWGNYNEHGADGGEWIELPMDEDELDEKLEAIAEAMGDHDPEWAIHDYEWTCEIDLGEVHEMDSIREWNELLQDAEDLTDYEQKEVAAAMEAFSYSLKDAIDHQRRGCFIFYPGQTIEDVAYELADEALRVANAPEFLAQYFDYKAYATELETSGYSETSYGVICD